MLALFIFAAIAVPSMQHQQRDKYGVKAGGKLVTFNAEQLPAASKSLRQQKQRQGEDSPFAHVLLIVTRMHADKAPTIQAAYGPHFWDTLYVSPRATSNETRFLRARGFAVADDCREYQAFDRGWLDVSYPCVGRLFSRLHGLTRSGTAPINALESRLQAKARETPLRGALVMQADFWVSPSFFAGLNLDQLVHLERKPDHCRDYDKLAAIEHSPEPHRDELWVWWNSNLDFLLREAAMATLQSSSLGLKQQQRVCIEWADMYYVPQQVWPMWSRVASIVGQKMKPGGAYPNMGILMNEVALPLIIDVINRYERTQCVSLAWDNGLQSSFSRLRRTRRSRECWGGFGPPNATATRDPAILSQFQCGHPMDLQSPQIREGLVNLWRSYETAIEPSSTHNNEHPISPRLRDPHQASTLKPICASLVIFTAIMVPLMYFVCTHQFMPQLANHAVSLCVMALYIAISVSIDLLVMAQKNADHHYKFNPLCAIILTELAKLVISVVAHLASPFQGCRPRLSDAAWICVPATCYTFNNILVFVAMAANGAATFGIFRDTVVLWTAAFWYFVYKVPLKRIRIAGLSLLCVGLLINRGSAGFAGVGPAWAFLPVVMMTLCNAMGAVSNEHVLKRNAELSINVQNMMLYMICAITSLAVLAISNPIRLLSIPSFFQGFSRQTVLMVALQAFAGILISRLLKYTDAVYKSVGACLRGPILAVIAPVFLQHEIPTSLVTLVSAVVVASGSFAYLSQGPLSAEVRKG